MFDRFAGEIFGITNTAGTVCGIISPVIVGALTTNVSSLYHNIKLWCCMKQMHFTKYIILEACGIDNRVLCWIKLLVTELKREVSAGVNCLDWV